MSGKNLLQKSPRWVFSTFIAAALALLLTQQLQATQPHIAKLEVQGPINPASADYIKRSLQQASSQGATVAIVELDTPGGLLSSTRDIIRTYLQSDIPIVTFVSPENARAASAGTFITYASHIAAMHPSSHIGAATPVQMRGQTEAPPDGEADNDTASSETSSSAMERKVLNDSVSQIRNLAEHYGRNADWAEQAVRKAATLTAREALENNVIEIVATSVADLINQIDGREVLIENTMQTLHSSGLDVRDYSPDLRNHILNFLSNPQLAYLLLLIGVYGLIFELMAPGSLFPGITGVVSLLLAAFSLQILPINVVGLLLILAGATMLLVEFFVPSFGIIGVGGVIALTAGSLMLFDSQIPGMELPMSIIITVVAVSLACVFFVAFVMARNRLRNQSPSNRNIVGLSGTVVENLNPQGLIRVDREIWPAQAKEARLITHGKPVRVVNQEGTLAYVEEIKKTEQKPVRS